MTEKEKKRQALVAKALLLMIKKGEAVLHEKTYRTMTGSYASIKFYKIKV